MWRGRFDPETFSVAEVNRKLIAAFPVRARAGSKKRLAPVLRMPAPEPPLAQTDPEEEIIAIELSARERELILNHTFADPELTDRLLTPPDTARPVFRYSAGDLDLLLGHVAAEANHATDRKLRKELSALFDRLSAALGL
jgi:hypothetical protein